MVQDAFIGFNLNEQRVISTASNMVTFEPIQLVLHWCCGLLVSFSSWDMQTI